VWVMVSASLLHDSAGEALTITHTWWPAACCQRRSTS